MNKERLEFIRKDVDDGCSAVDYFFELEEFAEHVLNQNMEERLTEADTAIALLDEFIGDSQGISINGWVKEWEDTGLCEAVNRYQRLDPNYFSRAETYGHLYPSAAAYALAKAFCIWTRSPLGWNTDTELVAAFDEAEKAGLLPKYSDIEKILDEEEDAK